MELGVTIPPNRPTSAPSQDPEDTEPLIGSAMDFIIRANPTRAYTRPRFDIPCIKRTWIKNGYILGNRNGRSMYNMLIEATSTFFFLVLLLTCLLHYSRKSTPNQNLEVFRGWKYLYIIPLAKNILLLPDFYQLKKSQKYSWWSLVVLLSNITVWGFSLYGFEHNKEIIFGNLRAKTVAEMKPNKVKGLFRVVMIDEYVQFSLLMLFLYQVYQKERSLDFYRDYFNPLNFVCSCTADGMLISVMTHKRSSFIWVVNFGVLVVIGLSFLVIFLGFLKELFKKKSDRLQVISKANRPFLQKIELSWVILSPIPFPLED